MVGLFRGAMAASMLAGEPTMARAQAPDMSSLIAETRALVASEAIVSGRVKSAESTLQKMQRKNLAFDDVLDRVGLRLRVSTVDECYTVLARLHERYQPIPSAFDDYIAAPKPNGYQSLHTVVLVPGVGPTEFQVRTHEMHDLAETGAAAHWRYKLASSKTFGV